MKIERCQNCKYFRDLKHNFKTGQGFEKSHACVVWEYCDDSVGWIQQVDPDDMCEMFTSINAEADNE